MLVRKADSSARVGEMIRQSAEGKGFSKIADALGGSFSTVRRRIRAACANATQILPVLALDTRELDPLAPVSDGTADTGCRAIVAALDRWVAAAKIRFGSAAKVARWGALSRLTNGHFATAGFGGEVCNTS
jgi:hypothetical protein